MGSYDTQRKHRVSVRTDRQRKENAGFVLEPMEILRRTKVLRWNLWKTQMENVDVALGPLRTQRKYMFCMGTYGKRRCCVGAYKKRKENTGVEWKPIENV